MTRPPPAPPAPPAPAPASATEADLLRAIHADPADPAPYLVYADHLLERGDPRGELIHLQLRLESIADADPAGDPLAARVSELLGPPSTWWHDRGASCGFRRGFLDSLRVPASVFLDHVATCAPADLDELAHLSHLLLGFSPSSPAGAGLFTGADLAAVLALPALRRLEELELLSHRLGPAAGLTLARADLPRLRSLRLDSTTLRDAGVAAFVEAAPELPALESLALTTNQLADPAALALARWPHLARLRALDLSSIDTYDPGCNAIRDRGAIALISSPRAGRLERLDLSENPSITNETALALAAAPHLSRLVDLRLAFTSIDDRGAEALAASPSLARLQLLDLGHTPLGDAGLAAVLGMPSLSTLLVSGTALTADGIRALVDAPSRLTQVHAVFSGLDLPDPLRDDFLRRYGSTVDFY